MSVNMTSPMLSGRSLVEVTTINVRHTLISGEPEVQPDKVKVVQNWPVPRNLTEVRSFIGLCSYYRRFIPRLADIAGPLHMLTQKNARFNWGPAEHEAFCKLKERLISAPILGMPCDEGTVFGHGRIRP